jgi:hypothetical protein
MENAIRVNADFNLARSEPDPECSEQLPTGWISVVDLPIRNEIQKLCEPDVRGPLQQLVFRIPTSLQKPKLSGHPTIPPKSGILPKPILVHCGSGYGWSLDHDTSRRQATPELVRRYLSAPKQNRIGM